jgi:tetratricopeptide (TPR) repeat protein
MSALLAQAKSMALGEDSSKLVALASELQFQTKHNFENNLQMNFQYDATLAGLKSSLFDLQNDGRDREKEMARGRADRETSLYNEGARAIDLGKWQAAVDRFDQVAEMKLKKADAALFWKAWAQNKLGQRTEALATLSAMEKEYPQSRWMDDAKKLEVEVKQLSGRPVSPDDQSDCELKLLALNGLQQADPAKAVPLLEKMIHSPDCAKIRSQAFFVLAQSNSPEARELMTKMARGEGVNPLVQQRAIQALGL